MVGTNKANEQQEQRNNNVNHNRVTRNLRSDRSSNSSRSRNSGNNSRTPPFRLTLLQDVYDRGTPPTTLGGDPLFLPSWLSVDEGYPSSTTSTCRIEHLMKVLDDALEILDQEDFINNVGYEK